VKVLYFFQDENSLLRYVNDTNRSIYAFELLPPPAVVDLKNKMAEEKSLPQVKLESKNLLSKSGGLLLLVLNLETWYCGY
jgi:hypothetical protein